MPTEAEYPEAAAAAKKVILDLLDGYARRDVPAFRSTYNYPTYRVFGGRVVALNPEDMTQERVAEEYIRVSDRTVAERMEVIHAGPDKVHLDVHFTRYRHDGAVIGSYESMYVITCEDEHWGVKINSSYAHY